MKILILIFFLLTAGISSCQRPNDPYNPETIKKQKLANQIRKKVALQLKEEKDLRPVGTMGQMLNEIQKLGLSFYYYKPVDIAEGRRLLIDSVNAMLDEINQDTHIRPFLVRHPFLPRNIQIEIFLYGSDRRDVVSGALSIISAADGYLRYEIRNPKTNRFLTVYKETYEEALERIADPTLPLVEFQPDPVLSPEELVRLRKGISFVTDDGSILQLGNDGCWIKPELKKERKETQKPINQTQIDQKAG